jgi:predicted metal-dependent phosphoesterase TrpH
LRGDLHCHTLHSDGDSWPAEMLAEAVTRGLDFLGVTDHNQTAHQADYAAVVGEDLPILLPGIEVTTYGGHWNAWGTSEWWEFRERSEAATSQVMQAAAARGALVSINHPRPFGPAWEYPNAVGHHAIEVWNGRWPPLNQVALAWWEQQLRAGKRLVALGGSDTHRLKRVDAAGRLGSPTTWAHVGDVRSPEGVLGALRAGRAFISREPCGPQLFLDRAADGYRVRVVDGGRAALVLVSDRGIEAATQVHTSDWTDTLRVPDERPAYVRAQLMDEHGQVLALTNPVFRLP